MTQLFISHSSKNNAEALALSQWLTAEGWDDQFLDIDPQRGITAGERWEKALHQAAGRCDAVLFLVSPDWLRSDWCRREFTIAKQLGKRLFVLLLDGAKRADVEASMKEVQLVDLEGLDCIALVVTLPGAAESVQVQFSRVAMLRLREGLKKAGLDPQSFPWPPSDEPNRAPYRGLAPLEAKDAGIFFGREAPITELLAQLRGLREAAPARFLAILGASGAGKSSFLRAGILPRLSRDDRYYLPLPVIRPERAVLSGSSGFLASLWTARQKRGLNWSRMQLEQAIEFGASALATLLAELARVGTVPDWDGRETQAPTLVLAIDQAEELFQSEGGEEATRFLALLAELLQADSPQILALCTIRSDNYDHLQSTPALLSVSQKTFSLPPLPKGAYQQVIEAPVSILKHSARPLKIEAKLTDALLTDMDQGGAKDALPLLAFTLERLYLQYAANGRLQLKDYEGLGRIAGAIETAVGAALEAAQKNPLLPKGRDECLKFLRRSLIPWMAGIDSRSGLPYRKVARLVDLPEEARVLIDHFVDYRLLAKDTNTQLEVTVEFSHEALFRQWEMLRIWLQEDSAALAMLEAVTAASREWEANKEHPKWLVHTAGRLEDAEALKARADMAASLTSSELRYLAKCRWQDDERREGELRQAQQLAEAMSARVEQQQAAVAAAQKAAWRALGRAREQLSKNNDPGYAAYLAESLEYDPEVAQEEASMALQQLPSPTLQMNAPHQGVVTCATFDPAGRLIATTSNDHSVAFFDSQSGTCVAKHLEHLGLCNSLSFSTDGGRVVTSAWNGRAQLWSVATCTTLGESMVHENTVRSAVFSSDGDTVLTASSDNTARLWNAHTGLVLNSPLLHQGAVNAAAFSANGDRVITASWDATSRVWDSQTGDQVAILNHDGVVFCAAFCPNGLRAVTAGADQVAKIWDVNKNFLLSAEMLHNGAVSFASFSPDGLRVLTTCSDHTARLWNACSGDTLGSPMKHTKVIESPSFSTDGRAILTAGEAVRIWDGQTGDLIQPAIEQTEWVNHSEFSGDGRLLVTAGRGGNVCVFDARRRKAIGLILRHHDLVLSVRFSFDGALAVTSDGSSAHVWKVDCGTLIGSTAPNYKASLLRVSFSRDSSRIVTGYSDGSAKIWNAQNLRLIGDLIGHSESVFAACFSPTGDFVLTAGKDCSARLWCANTGEPIGRPMTHEDTVWSAVFSLGGDKVATASADCTARVWDPSTGLLKTELKHESSVQSVIFSADGKRLLTCSFDGQIHIWDAETGAAVANETRVSDRAISAEFAMEERIVIGAGVFNTKIWEIASAECSIVRGRFGSVIGSRMLISQSEGSEIWDINGRTFVGKAFGSTYCTDASLSPDGLRALAAFSSEGCVWETRTAPMLGSPVSSTELIALAGQRVGSDGRLEWIPGAEWMQIINEAKARAEKGTTPKDQIMRWHFADRSARTISPFSQITVPQHIEREINWVLEHPQTEEPDGPNYSPKILDDAYNLDPGHPLILLALSVFEDRPETKALWKRLSFPRFEKDARLAARAAEILLIDKDPENARKAAEMALTLPTATDADRAKAQAVMEKIKNGNQHDG